MDRPPPPDHPTIFCTKCSYPLTGLPSLICPECGTEFDPRDLASFRRALVNPTILARNLDDSKAEYLRLLLETEGIHARVEHGVRTALVVLDYGATLWVNSQDEARAREAIERYDAAELEDAQREPWSCPECGEENDGHFLICWQCQTDRPAS